jgi:hypothetical protein
MTGRSASNVTCLPSRHERQRREQEAQAHDAHTYIRMPLVRIQLGALTSSPSGLIGPAHDSVAYF